MVYTTGWDHLMNYAGEIPLTPRFPPPVLCDNKHKEPTDQELHGRTPLLQVRSAMEQSAILDARTDSMDRRKSMPPKQTHRYLEYPMCKQAPAWCVSTGHGNSIPIKDILGIDLYREQF